MDFSLLDQIMAPKKVTIEPPKKQYGFCCDVKMHVVNESKLLCLECKRVTRNLGEYGNKPESQKAQYNIFGGVLPGANILKTDGERIDLIVCEYSRKLNFSKGLCDPKILRTAAELMFQFSKSNTKKSQNRDQFFGACLYFASIRHKNILMDRDIVKMLRLKVSGISKGINIIARYTIKHKIPFEFDPPIYRLAIKYYLRVIYHNRASLNTKPNRKFCRRMVEQMNELGIGYDKGILIKCASAVYYMLCYKSIEHRYKKKDISELMGLVQHSYTPIYKLLIRKEINNLLDKDTRLSIYEETSS